MNDEETTNENRTLGQRETLIQHACSAAANVLAGRGVTPEDIANGMIAFGGAIALELVGSSATADLFQSKADGLRKTVQ